MMKKRHLLMVLALTAGCTVQQDCTCKKMWETVKIISDSCAEKIAWQQHKIDSLQSVTKKNYWDEFLPPSEKLIPRRER